MDKTLVFDMDGTIADFYGVAHWLQYLDNEDTTPYDVALPLYDMVYLNAILTILKHQGWKIAITTWLSKDGTKEFKDVIAFIEHAVNRW